MLVTFVGVLFVLFRVLAALAEIQIDDPGFGTNFKAARPRTWKYLLQRYLSNFVAFVEAFSGVLVFWVLGSEVDRA
jgi:hypothetical protein